MKKLLFTKCNNTVHTLLMVTLFSLSNICFAEDFYLGVDYVLSDVAVASEDAKANAVGLRAGASNNNMAFEVQYLLGGSDDIYRMSFDLEKSAALYFVMQSDVRNGFGIDVSLGYAMTDMTVSGPEQTYNGEDNYNGFSWGVSMHQRIPYFEQTTIRFGYQSLYKDSYIEITNMSLGITYNF
jgi:hypothetical protein